ncbi:methylamine utilization protein [Solimicrobium silvestre]|uniref:Plastocyanin n=1 Tax=Solimicrobium silvestre TaxID=2099400 RepID=A0A2S9H5N8_9BURK|nr:methylamine utilization protein [Solimicrobium silvestre]PRC95243.1 hypothetical protein S2091_0438 [Solimicrobium silvestre]
MENQLFSGIHSIAPKVRLFSLFGAICLTCLVCLSPSPLLAATLSVQVTDSLGAPLEDVVVYAEPVSGEKLPKSVRAVEIAQKHRQFVPLVTVVQAGTEISFPNLDTVKHHVYSFSPTKYFDLPLYSGMAAKPQLFDLPGTVVLGCNIHDKMVAYVQVVNTPYFAKTDATGKVKLNGIIPGKYQLKAWHFMLPPLAQVVTQPINIVGDENTASFKLNVKQAKPATEDSTPIP